MHPAKHDLELSPIRPYLTKINVNREKRLKKKAQEAKAKEKEKYHKIVNKQTKLIRVNSPNKHWKDVIKSNT